MIEGGGSESLEFDDIDMGHSDAGALLSAPRRLRRWRERYREVGLSVILGLQVTIMFVISPLGATGLISAEATQALRFGLAATAIFIVNRSPAIGALLATSFIVSLLCTIFLRTGVAGNATLLANIVVTIAFDLAVAWAVAHAAFGPGRISVHRIMGAIILYLYIGLIFASIFHLAVLTLHPSISNLPTRRGATFSSLLYFSMSTLTTSGFGDIVPVHPLVRSLANLESVMGQLYPATLLARLVTLHGAVMGGGNGDDEDTPPALR